MIVKKYENATISITRPTAKQQENLRKSIERFLKKLAKDGLIDESIKRCSN